MSDATSYCPAANSTVVSVQSLDDPDWIEVNARVVNGHGVASGRAADSPYPKGSIELQAPFFRAAGIDLSGCFLGTLNLSIAPFAFDFYAPAITVYDIKWTDIIDAEHFSFSPCEILVKQQLHRAWIYYPRPETKTLHFQPADMVEVIAPKVPVRITDVIQIRFLRSQVRLTRQV